MIPGSIIVLAAVTAGLAVALIVRGIQLAKQFQATLKRVAELELRVKELAEREVLPSLDAVASLSARVEASRPSASDSGRFYLDGWVEYLPRLLEIVGRFSDSGRKGSEESEK